MSCKRQIVEVVGAIIREGDRFLVGQRAAAKSQGSKWEFIGGKIEPCETPEQALASECREELALEIENEKLVASIIHSYPETKIRLTLISCTPKVGAVPTALEHQALRLVTREEMDLMDFAAADRELIEKLRHVSVFSPLRQRTTRSPPRDSPALITTANASSGM